MGQNGTDSQCMGPYLEHKCSLTRYNLFEYQLHRRLKICPTIISLLATTHIAMSNDNIIDKIFSQLGREKQLMEYNDILYKMMGLVLDYMAADGSSLRLTKVGYFSSFCKYVRSCEKGLARCHECDLKYNKIVVEKGTPIVYACHAGLNDVIVPLFDDKGKYIGGLTTGQFLKENESNPPDMRRLAKDLGLSAKQLTKYRKNVTRLSDLQQTGLIEYLQIIGRLVLSTRNHVLWMEKENAKDRMKCIFDHIEKNYMQQITAAGTARHFGMCRVHFSRLFKADTGISFPAYVAFLRIAKAKELLLETKYLINEVAFHCGFGSLSQFNRVFKQIVGSTPKLWLNQQSTQKPS